MPSDISAKAIAFLWVEQNLVWLDKTLTAILNFEIAIAEGRNVAAI